MADPTLKAEFAALVAAVADRHDRPSFERLFDYFAPRLNGYLLRLGADPAMAEEVIQDVMVTLWRKADQFDPQKSTVSTWLYRIARNRRIDILRRTKVEILDGEEPDLPVDDDGLSDLIERENAVRAALDHLPPEQLTLLRMAFFDSLSHSEISERTGLPLGTVKSRIRLGFARLRREMEAHEANVGEKIVVRGNAQKER